MNDILNNPPKGSKAWSEKDESVQYPKGSKAWSESASTEDNKDSKQKSTPEKSETDKKRTPFDVVKNDPEFQKVAENAYKKVINPEQQEKKTLSYSELYELLNPKPDEEKYKKEANRARANNAIAALGDGISALANIHFTTKGAPNMYDGKNTLTAQTQARYDKLLKDYEENLEKYRQGRLKAEQLDKEWNHRAEREKAADEQFAQNQQRLKDESERQQNNWDKTFEENKRQFDENLKRLKDQADKEFEERKRVNNSTINRNNYYINGGKNGKSKDPEYMPFTSSNKETNVSIRKDVWESNWPYLFGIIVNEGYNMDDFLTKNLFKNMDDKQKETFVKEHWEDSDMARGYMKRMSEIYPNDEFNKEYNSPDKNSDNDNTAPYLR